MDDDRTVLATFDPEVALAVAAVLRRRGLPAAVEATTSEGLPGEAAVVVPVGRREEALGVLASSMEEVAAGRGTVGADSSGAHQQAAEVGDTGEAERPLVLERLRRLGGIALILIPLLVITLQAPPALLPYAGIVIIGGLVAVLALRDRWGRDE